MRVKTGKNQQRLFWGASAGFLFIALLVGILSFQYYRALQDTVTNESHEYLQELSTQIASNASRNIGDNFAVLGTIANVLKSAKIQTYQELQPEVRAQQSFWNYRDILLIDGNGNAYDANGNIVLLSGDIYLREAIVNRRRAISSSQVVNGTECLVFVIPISDLSINGTEMFALAATYDLSSIDSILSISAFSGHGYAHIIQKDGAVVIRSSSKQAPQFGYNILNSLASAIPLNEIAELEKVKANIFDNESGSTAFTLHGKRVYMTYTPLQSHNWALLGFVPVEVVNAKSELFIRITFLLCAGITLAFAILVAYIMLTFSRHKHKLEQIAYVDPVTGGNTIELFYEEARALLTKPNRSRYALVFVNLESFKLLNEEFGRPACDELLRCVYDGISTGLSNDETLGRLFADNMCVLINYESEDLLRQRCATWYATAAVRQAQRGGVWLAPIIEFGVYLIGNDSLPFPQMIDRAKLATREIESELQGRVRLAIYDDAISRRLFREKHLEGMMNEAMRAGEFQVYLQPKYHTQSETVGGAEALVRWLSREGMIYPDEFISLFEKNGFIVQLDLWVFEEVCRRIRIWLDAGLIPMKVSVNCSRVHLKNPRFLERFIAICQKHDTPPEYLEFELTENLVFEDVGHLSTIINSVHAAGFGCSMDDFGSGYSSLNLIQDIPVDTLKLDKVFFRRTSHDLDRTESVVGSILVLARALKLSTVAEGVEERTQVDMLKRLGCDYIQGYYFAKPMPIADFERLVFNTEIPNTSTSSDTLKGVSS